jgi:hypothetical protein
MTKLRLSTNNPTDADLLVRVCNARIQGKSGASPWADLGVADPRRKVQEAEGKKGKPSGIEPLAVPWCGGEREWC